MGHRRQRASLDGRPLRTAIVPKYDLSRVSATKNQVRMKSSEAAREYGGLTMEDVFGCRFLEASIPNKADTIRIMGRVLQRRKFGSDDKTQNASMNRSMKASMNRKVNVVKSVLRCCGMMQPEAPETEVTNPCK